jgi:hypothetical protein
MMLPMIPVTEYDLAKFSNSPRKNQGFGRASRAQNPDFFLKLAKSYD